MLLLDEPRPSVAGDADALIEEARRRTRRRRRRGSVTVLVALAGALVGLAAAGGGGGSVRTHPGRGGDPSSAAGQRPTTKAGAATTRLAALPTIAEMGLIAPGVGWAVNGIDFYVTSDDGAHWRTTQPPGAGGDVIANVSAVTSFGGRELFVAGSGEPGYGTCAHPIPASEATGRTPRFVKGTVATTNDAGRSWRVSVLGDCAFAASLSFPASQTGFALSSGAIVPDGRPTGGVLYETTDGARSWRRVAPTPFDGPIDFTSARDGWGLAALGQLRPRSAQGVLYRTTDGGRRWRRDPLCSGGARDGTAVICGTPTFFGTRDGVVPVAVVDSRTGADSFHVYSTDNAGRSWTASEPPADPRLRAYLAAHDAYTGANGAIRMQVPFSAASPTSWFVFIGPRLYSTADAGRHWTTITPRPTFAAPSIAAYQSDPLDFVSASDGWVITGDSTRFANPAQAFDRTTDGGRTWRPLARQ